MRGGQQLVHVQSRLGGEKIVDHGGGGAREEDGLQAGDGGRKSSDQQRWASSDQVVPQLGPVWVWQDSTPA